MDYFLVGSFASGFRGKFRATNDLDIVCRFPVEAQTPFAQQAKDGFYCGEVAFETALAKAQSFNLIYEQTFVKVDLFTRITEFEAEPFGLSTALRIPGSGQTVNVSTAEYNIIAKLNWFLKSNGVLERQIRDVISMIVINRDTLDLDYLRRWALFFGIEQLLDETLESCR